MTENQLILHDSNKNARQNYHWNIISAHDEIKDWREAAAFMSLSSDTPHPI